MTDKRDKALEWIEKQIRQTRQALGRAEYKPGVKPDELENLRGKIEVLEFISGAVLKADDTEPTLDYAPVEHGKWGIPEIIGYTGIHAVYGAPCSECGAYSREHHRLFCSNCGARMDGKEDGNDAVHP